MLEPEKKQYSDIKYDKIPTSHDVDKDIKKGYPPSEYPFSYFLYKTNTYASATTFFTETKERFSLPLRKVTTPSTNAYNV